ncbi:DUF6907 domain-containing protein [Streptomyces halobius]|uniref:Immunity protein 53 of polymorphic toxin system n=1 Tax=Streptomyces halobius TaxID=2879846 RepID=A0ABY4M1X1_9ACTN|nr:hypothetical protein [Streptomyces halobius]UQA91427.1 hypothetical protein K9S39_05630 [Streptomyces halobius]
MNAQDWKLSVTGDNCPEWCAGEHADEDPEYDSIIHESAPITVPLPPMVNGKRIHLAFTTSCSEDYMTADEGRRPVRVELGTENELRVPTQDYVPVATAGDLDTLIHNLRQATIALEQWRDRLPSAA